MISNTNVYHKGMQFMTINLLLQVLTLKCWYYGYGQREDKGEDVVVMYCYL